jgi:formylglycine-generating enzyme required for sulfatase activity
MLICSSTTIRPLAAAIAVLVLGVAAARPVAAGERYAFLVGVRQYNKAELTSLQFTENDISQLADILVQSGYAPENVVVMTQARGALDARFAPFARNIVDELSLLIGELTEEDSILVAFAGHGVQFKGDDDAYFCPADARLKDRASLVSLGDVYRSLKECQAGSKVLLVDACRNDPQSRLSRAAGEVELEAVGRPQRVAPPGGVAAFFSCSAGQQSYELPDLEHGVFFHYVNAGLAGGADFDADGEITMAELEQFTVKNVQRHVRTELGRKQTPERRGEARGLITLATTAGATVEPEPPPTIPEPAPEPAPIPPPAAPAAAEVDALDGAWVASSTQSTYQIRVIEGRPELVSVVDDDGEEYPVVTSSWNGRALRWKIKIPSTGYVVEERVTLQDQNTLAGNWTSTAPGGEKNEGTDTWSRSSPEASAPSNEIENSIGMRFALIPAGTFLMGSPETEEGHEADELLHEVRISRPFRMGIHEVTQAQYERVIGSNPSAFKAGGDEGTRVEGLDTSNFPVENVTWEEAAEFCRRLSALPEEQAAGRTYRLPTEAEREYACRAGTTTPFYFGDSLSAAQANFAGDSPYGGAEALPGLGRTTTVGSYPPNAWGLYDMHGNVYEFCADYFAADYYANSPVDDPQGPADGTERAVRDGGVFSIGAYLRSADRFGYAPAERSSSIGFRVVCEVGARPE